MRSPAAAQPFRIKMGMPQTMAMSKARKARSTNKHKRLFSAAAGVLQHGEKVSYVIQGEPRLLHC